uniref:phosphate acyltransferase n=1 Tax=Staphylococcus saprophyticus TaxID=29385 RepID=UPI0021B1F3BB
QYIFGDCPINPTLQPQHLPQIPLQTPKSPKSFTISPPLPILTFSTKPSPKSHRVEKLPTPLNLPQHKIQPDHLQDLVLDPQFQFHPAILPQLPNKKPPHPKIQPHPNLFLFPSLQPPNV